MTNEEYADVVSAAFRAGYGAGIEDWADANSALIASWMPQCGMCGRNDRMIPLPPVRTDFGGVLYVGACRRCGILAVIPVWERR